MYGFACRGTPFGKREFYEKAFSRVICFPVSSQQEEHDFLAP